MSKKCSNCKNLQQSVYMKLEDKTLYSYWCEVGNVEDETCDKFIAKNNLSKANKTFKDNCMDREGLIDLDSHMKIVNFLIYLQSINVLSETERIHYSNYIQDYLKEKII